MDVLLECLKDENVEVREMAARTLAGVIRCSQRQSILPLRVGTLGFVETRCFIPNFLDEQDLFVTQAKHTRLPPRSSPQYADALRTLHGSILGIVALIDAYPYSVEGKCRSP